MLHQPTLEKLKELKFSGMLKGLEEQLNSSNYESLCFEERLGLLVDREITERENRRLNTRLTQAKLRHKSCMEDIDYSSKRGMSRSSILSLSSCNWIKEKLNILITGPTGIGKSFLACALAHKACLEGYRARYYRTSRLFQDLKTGHGDGSYQRILNSISKVNLLVIDDWGLKILNEQERNDLLEIMEDRHGVSSTIITSQLPVKDWHQIIANDTLADAILDRIVHNAYRIDLAGESMRKTKAKESEKKS